MGTRTRGGRGGWNVSENEIGDRIVASALAVHTALGPGLLESAYEQCLAYELRQAGLAVGRQEVLPLVYRDAVVDAGYRLDLLVEGQVVIELQAVEALTPSHLAQILSDLKLGGFKLGDLLNFNVVRMKDGIRRVANGL